MAYKIKRKKLKEKLEFKNIEIIPNAFGEYSVYYEHKGRKIKADFLKKKSAEKFAKELKSYKKK